MVTTYLVSDVIWLIGNVLTEKTMHHYIFQLLFASLLKITTDIRGGCIENFQGTSAAAPLATGCIATVLEAK